MAFGQPSGPPASARQVRELLLLVRGAGHTDFRDARGPLRFTQRQAAGRFSRDEATAYIEQLRETASDTSSAVASSPADQLSLHGVPAEQLAGELQRRGWTVSKP